MLWINGSVKNSTKKRLLGRLRWVTFSANDTCKNFAKLNRNRSFCLSSLSLRSFASRADQTLAKDARYIDEFGYALYVAAQLPHETPQ